MSEQIKDKLYPNLEEIGVQNTSNNDCNQSNREKTSVEQTNNKVFESKEKIDKEDDFYRNSSSSLSSCSDDDEKDKDDGHKNCKKRKLTRKRNVQKFQMNNKINNPDNVPLKTSPGLTRKGCIRKYKYQDISPNKNEPSDSPKIGFRSFDSNEEAAKTVSPNEDIKFEAGYGILSSLAPNRDESYFSASVIPKSVIPKLILSSPKAAKRKVSKSTSNTPNYVCNSAGNSPTLSEKFSNSLNLLTLASNRLASSSIRLSTPSSTPRLSPESPASPIEQSNLSPNQGVYMTNDPTDILEAGAVGGTDESFCDTLTRKLSHLDEIEKSNKNSCELENVEISSKKRIDLLLGAPPISSIIPSIAADISKSILIDPKINKNRNAYTESDIQGFFEEKVSRLIV